MKKLFKPAALVAAVLIISLMCSCGAGKKQQNTAEKSTTIAAENQFFGIDKTKITKIDIVVNKGSAGDFAKTVTDKDTVSGIVSGILKMTEKTKVELDKRENWSEMFKVYTDDKVLYLIPHDDNNLGVGTEESKLTYYHVNGNIRTFLFDNYDKMSIVETKYTRTTAAGKPAK